MLVELTRQEQEEYERIYRTYQEKIDRVLVILNDSSASDQDRHDASRELYQLHLDRGAAAAALSDKIDRREFAKLGGDRDKIIESAKEQVSLWLDSRFALEDEYFSRAGVPATTYGIRFDGKRIYLDEETAIEESKHQLNLHFDALSKDSEALALLNDLIRQIVEKNPNTTRDKGLLWEGNVEEQLRELEREYEKGLGKPKPRKRSKRNLPTFSESAKQDFFLFSTTQAKDVYYNLLSTNSDVNETAQMINAVSRKKQAQVYTGESSRALKVDTDNSQTVIEILGSVCQKVNSRTAKKILHFIESELYQRTYYKGQMNDDIVTFPLQKMVDKKLYTSVQNARRAFYEASNVLTAFRVSATVKSGKKEVSLSDGNARFVLFPTMLVENGQCIVRLNRDINWSPFLKDFFLMPDSWWALPDNASDLEYKIFRKVRMHKERLDERGIITVNISLQSVASWLSLPLETKNPKQLVKSPIERAVKEIRESLDPKSFNIEIKTDLNASLPQYLSGHLVVTVGGAYTENLIDLNRKQQSKIEQAAKRKEEIVKESSIRMLTEQMKSEGEDPAESAK